MSSHIAQPDPQIIREGYDQSIPPRRLAEIPAADDDFDYWLRFARVSGPIVDANLFTAEEWRQFRRACRHIEAERRPEPTLPSANIGRPYAPDRWYAGATHTLPSAPDDPGDSHPADEEIGYSEGFADGFRARRWFNFAAGLTLGFALSAAFSIFALLKGML